VLELHAPIDPGHAMTLLDQEDLWGLSPEERVRFMHALARQQALCPNPEPLKP